MTATPSHITINQNFSGDIVAQGHVGVVLQVLKEDSDYLLALKPLGRAEWNAGISEITACLKGTREAVLKDINDWLKHLDSPPIYWLTGSAGTGKSCISYTVCERYSKEKILGATFFFSRDEDTRSKVDHVFRTLAHRLCVNFPETIQPRVLAALKKDSTLYEPLPERHLPKLVVDPIREISASLPAPILIVIDALDECQWRHGESAIVQFISMLAEELGDRRTRLKVFITSRPEYPTPIFSRRNVRVERLAELVRQYDVEASIPQSDLNLYVSHEMTMLAEAYRTHWSPISQLWPSDDDIQDVLRIAGSLFISAATILRMLKAADKGATPHPHKVLRRLRAAIPETPAAPTAAAASHDLDQLYREVLKVAAQRHAGEDNWQNIQRLLAFVVLSSYPLSVRDIGALLGFTADPLIPVLHPVLGTPGSEEPVRTLHTSFRDFITNSRRCTRVDIRFISPPQSHLDLAIACLRQLRHLQRDILGLGTMSHRNENLADIIKTKITGSQHYAVRHWETHLSQCTISESAEQDELLNCLSAFIETNILQHIEALSYLGLLAKGRASLEKIVALPIAEQLDPRVNSIIHDACHLMREHHTVISQGAMHVYASALPFVPRQTQIYRSFSNAGSSLFPIIEGHIPSHWNMCIQSINMGDAITALEYSPDGQSIAVGTTGANRFNIQLLDAFTCKLLLNLPVGNRSGFLALSPDSDRVVCSSGSTVKIYSCRSGKLLLESTIAGDKSEIVAISFSSKGESIVVCSRDNTLRSWDIGTGRELAAIRIAKRDGYESVKFSCDGTKLTAWGTRGLVLMDCQTGKKIRKYDTNKVTSANFSPDGSRIAAGSSDNFIRIWSTDSNKILLKFKGHPSTAVSLAFSRNGQFIIIGSRNSDVMKLWDGGRGQLLQTLQLTRGNGSVVDVLYDGSRVISGSEDGHLHVWDPTTRSSNPEAAVSEYLGHYVRYTAMSQDGTRAITGSISSNVLKVWDLNTGNYLFDITEVPSHPASLAMSRDAAVVVVWSDSTGWVWDGRTGVEKLRLEAPSPEGGFGYSKDSPVVADDDGTAIISDGMTFLCLDRTSGSIVLWDLNTGLSRPLKNELPPNPIVAVATSQDGGYVACGLRYEQAIEVVDVKSGGLVSTLRGLEVAAGSRIAISPDNEIVLACTSGKAGRAWELKTGKAIEPLCDVFRAIESWDMDVLRFVFLCGSTFVATYLSHTKKAHLEVKIWDASTGEEVVETKPRIPDSASQPALSQTKSIRDHLLGPDRWIHAVYSDRRRYSVCYLPLLYGAITSSCFRGDIGIVGFDSGRVLTFRMPVPHDLAS